MALNGSGPDETEGKPPTGFDPAVLARNLTRIGEESGKAIAAWLRPREGDTRLFEPPVEAIAALKALGRVGAAWLREPERFFIAQRKLLSDYSDAWTNAIRRWSAGPSQPPAPVADKRFRDPDWSGNPFFSFLRDAYLATGRWAQTMVAEAEGLDADARQKAEFHLRQVLSAIAPSNFLLTNPELLRKTLDSNGENLIRGMQMLAEDIEAGHGNLRIRQADTTTFEVGRDLATTPGKVILQNEVCQLIQYEPATPDVLRRPLLIVPPWINKFYVLDLTAEKSFIRWCVGHGHTVFVISWVNPDARLAGKSFEHYMREGILTALDTIEAVTGEAKANAAGYCVGGTLLAVTLAWMAATGDDRIASATFFATQVDFTRAGDLRAFVDEEQIAAVEAQMQQRGYLDGQRMASAFNMLRPNDLIWPYVVGTYLMGDAPKAFDLLHWNADATRMPAANHSFYLRNCYLENRLARGEMEVAGVRLDLGKVRIPVYNLATREDHIAPAVSVYKGGALFGGPVTFVVTGSGHIAGVINPPARGKYQYWTDGDPSAPDAEAWVKSAKEHPGSWWPHWHAWVEAQAPARTKPRKPGSRRFRPIEDAPGSYVRVMA